MTYGPNVSPINPAGKPSPVCQGCGLHRSLCECDRTGDALDEEALAA